MPAAWHAGSKSVSAARSRVAAAARTPSASTSLMSTLAVLKGRSKVSISTTPARSVGMSARAAIAPEELSLSSARSYVSSTRGRVPAATAASTAAALPTPTSTLPTSTPAMRLPVDALSPSPAARPGSQNHMRMPSPAPRAGFLCSCSPSSSVPGSPASSSMPGFASTLPMICSVRMAPPCHAPPPRATFLDWFITVSAHRRSAMSWHT
mmetsp:Transcript_14130/g.38817  ORF Transcript_14130/g.38817 Transcript_14130/m.38817 type:complete len:209 (+) Transcript_14130:1428-2054(+)